MPTGGLVHGPPDGGPRISVRPAANEPINFLGTDIDIDEVEDVTMDTGDDRCCAEARERLASLIEEFARTADPFTRRMIADLPQGIRTDEHGDWTCEDIQWKMEKWAEGSSWERGVANAVLTEWEKCSAGGLSGDFTASADPFEAGWNQILKLDLDPSIEDQAPLRQRVEDILLPDDDTIPTDDENNIDMGNDPCCGEAREAWENGLVEQWGQEFATDPEGGLPILESYNSDSCEEFRASLEARFTGDGRSAVMPSGTLAWEDRLARSILANWDKCAEENFQPSDEEGGFYASVHPFEAGWDIMLKEVL